MVEAEITAGSTRDAGETPRPRRRRRRLLRLGAIGVLALVVAACEGTWERTANPSPVRAVHGALLRTGKVLLIAGSGNSVDEFRAGSFKTAIYDPKTDTIRSDIQTPYDLFCGGHAFLPDGRLLVVGGTGDYDDGSGGYIGLKESVTFDPVTETYQPAPDMAIGRWYPTVVTRGDGKLIATAGYDEKRQHSNTFQIFDPVTNSWSTDKPLGNPNPGGVGIYSPLYPSFHLMADGRLFYSGNHAWALGPGTSPYIWNSDTNQVQWLSNDTIDVDRRDQGASVLLPPAQDQKVMVIAGDGLASTAVIDLKQPNPRYQPGPPIDAGKMYVSAVILPDGRVLQTGGADGWRENPGVQYVRSTQILDPKTMTWTKAVDATVDRTYHSGALLLPDGRVLTFGGDPVGGNFQMEIEIFSPSYMTKPRPKLTNSPPTNVTYGQTFTVRTDVPIGSAVLIRPSAATHSSDSDQRSVDLELTPGGTVTSVRVPANRNLTPPGWYMLFVRDADNVPSVARWIKVG